VACPEEYRLTWATGLMNLTGFADFPGANDVVTVLILVYPGVLGKWGQRGQRLQFPIVL